LGRVDTELVLAGVDFVSDCNLKFALLRLQIVSLTKKCHQLDVELRDSRQHVKCLKKISRIQHRESVASEKSVDALLLIS